MATTTTTITNGITVSFNNTPQAGDDFFTSALSGLAEDQLGIVYLNVMANDQGGAAKTLYSVGNGTNTLGVVSATDLLTKDATYATATAAEAVIGGTSDTSFNGARIWLTSDGKVGYDASTLSAGFKSQLNALSDSQFLTDTFTYAIRLGNGTLSWATATVQIAGRNDAATFTGDDTQHVTETNAVLTTGGTLVVHDVDSAATIQAQTNVAGSHGSCKVTIATNRGWGYTAAHAP